MRQESVDDFEDLLLLAAGQLGDSFEGLADFAARGGRAARGRFAEHLLDGDAQKRDKGDRQPERFRNIWIRELGE